MANIIRRNEYFLMPKHVCNNPELSLEAIGMYACIMADALRCDSIITKREDLLDELIAAGYVFKDKDFSGKDMFEIYEFTNKVDNI